MMYDETDQGDRAEATDDALVSFDSFRDKYLAAGAARKPGLFDLQGRPVIFIFPKGESH